MNATNLRSGEMGWREGLLRGVAKSCAPELSYRRRRPVVRYEQIRRMPNYESATEVERVDATISPAEFDRRFRIPRRPVVVVGAVREWPSYERWDVEHARRVAGSQAVAVTRGLVLDYVLQCVAEGRLTSRSRAEIASEWFETQTCAEYIDRITHEFDPEEAMYARNTEIPSALRADLRSLSFLPAEEEASMFFGRRTYSDSHEHKGRDAVMMQMRGTKEVILHAPDSANDRALYGSARLFDFSNWSPVRFFDVDLELFPRFTENRPCRARVEPGDALYIPNPWWHAVVALDDEIQFTTTYWYAPRAASLMEPPTLRALVYREERSLAELVSLATGLGPYGSSTKSRARGWR